MKVNCQLYSCFQVNFKMKLLTVFGSLLCASTALAGNSPHKRNVFNKVKPVLEKRVANKPFEHPEIQKRAFSFLTNKTQGSFVVLSLSAFDRVLT